MASATSPGRAFASTYSTQDASRPSPTCHSLRSRFIPRANRMKDHLKNGSLFPSCIHPLYQRLSPRAQSARRIDHLSGARSLPASLSLDPSAEFSRVKPLTLFLSFLPDLLHATRLRVPVRAAFHRDRSKVLTQVFHRRAAP